MEPWTRRSFLVAAASTVACGTPARPVDEKPNVVVIMLDQLRASALSVYGETNIQTPAMDALIAAGAKMDTAIVANPLCSPARASLMTGAYSAAVGVPTNDRQLQPDVQTLGTAFGLAGYKTGYIGKWHLAKQKSGAPRHPCGFTDHFAGYNERYAYKNSQYWLLGDTEPRTPNPKTTFEPTYQTTQALDLMRKWKDVPFTIFVSYTPPHPPPNWRKDWDPHFPDEFPYGVEPAGLKLRPNVPEWAETTHGNEKKPLPGARAFLRNYYGAILSMEPEIARLTAGLKSMGLDERTIVVFTADHGDLAGSHGRYLKQKPYEESVHVPLSFRWTGKIDAKSHRFPISNIDILPTLAGLAGVPLSAPVHGRDVSAAILGGPAPTEPVYSGCHLKNLKNRWLQARTARWAFTLYDGPDKKDLLFDMDADPYQLDNRIEDPAHEALRKELTAKIELAKPDILGRKPK